MNKTTQLATQHPMLKDLDPKLSAELAVKLGKQEAGDLPFVRKYYTVEKFDVEEEGTVVGYITTESVDRDDEIVVTDGIDLAQYEKAPRVLWSHDWSALPIGKCLWIKRAANGLIAKIKFASEKANPIAAQVHKLFVEGVLNAFSIGYLPIEIEEKPKDHPGVSRIFSKTILVEISVCNIPANPEALALAVKSGKITNAKLLKDLNVETKEDDVKQITQAQPVEPVVVAAGATKVEQPVVEQLATEIKPSVVETVATPAEVVTKPEAIVEQVQVKEAPQPEAKVEPQQELELEEAESIEIELEDPAVDPADPAKVVVVPEVKVEPAKVEPAAKTEPSAPDPLKTILEKLDGLVSRITAVEQAVAPKPAEAEVPTKEQIVKFVNSEEGDEYIQLILDKHLGR